MEKNSIKNQHSNKEKHIEYIKMMLKKEENNYNKITKNENSFLKENSLIDKNNKKKTKIYLRKITKMRIQLLIIIFIIHVIIIF